jgi:uncharacterized protein YutE (UPF0331/DUF86 family)
VDFPRQHAALLHAMDAFGAEFDLTAFKNAFEETRDMDAYSRAQVVEHSVARVQTYVAELAIAGTKLAALELPKGTNEGLTERAFAALAQAGVVDPPLARQLKKAQAARNRIEHGYVNLSAGEVHAAAEEIGEISREFIGRYSAWIEPYL